jgi:hypothetical protein
MPAVLAALAAAASTARAQELGAGWDVAAFPAESVLVKRDNHGKCALLQFELPADEVAITDGGLRLYVESGAVGAQLLTLHALRPTSWQAASCDTASAESLGERLGAVGVQRKTRAWHVWDLSAYLARESRAARHNFAFAVHSHDGPLPKISLAAEGESNRPELRYSRCTRERCKPAVGVYVGNKPPDVSAFEGWLGRPVDAVLAYTGDKSWADYDGSVPWAVALWSGLDRSAMWSVPLIPRGASLELAASGAYNAHYRRAARQLAAFRPQDRTVYVRTAWEWNGDWFPWSVKASTVATFIAAWRQFVDTFRSVSPRFRFDWCPALGRTPFRWEDAYPGDAYVDVIGIDVYDESRWTGIDEPEARFAHQRSRSYGLDWVAAFAASRRKPISVAEWGVGGNGSGDNPVFVQRMHQWIAGHPVIYHAYWNSNADYPGQLSKGQHPRAAAKYRELFGR